MKKLIATLLIGLSINCYGYTGADLYNDTQNNYGPLQKSFGLGFILGVAQCARNVSATIPGYCDKFASNNKITAGQLEAIVVKWLKSNPDKWHLDASTLSVLAIRNAFCPETMNQLGANK